MERKETLRVVLEGLMRRYQERVPEVGSIMAAMIEEGLIPRAEAIENDHIAFRTMGVPQLGLRSCERIFQHYGYQPRDRFTFAAKNLNARWYSPPEPEFPRVFISELRVGDLSPQARAMITSYTDEVPRDPVDDLDLDDGLAVDAFLHQALWRLPTWEEYLLLAGESEYAAWVIYNRYYLNHFTISVHNLPSDYDTIAEFNRFLQGHGFALNDAGGTIKTSADGGLVQSSTVARMIEASFAGGDRHRISGSYVEFAERRLLPEYRDLPRAQIRRSHRRDGFEAGNADKIFESTYRNQTEREAASRGSTPSIT
jgi:hypothetical protein